MILPIDHGNKQIKSANSTFVSGLLESDTRPPIGEDILKYRNKYYTLSEQRIPYMRDKTVNNKFFILTLFAIAYEIEQAGIYSDDEIIDMQLLIGLPPAHYGSQFKRFEGYFANDGDIIDFDFRNKSYSIYISEVVAFPQAYAAVMPVFNRIRNIPKATVIDIGGFTADYLQIKYGQADLSICDSLENGVIVLYNQIKSKVNADHDLLLEESDIDSVLHDKDTDFSEPIIRIINQQAQAFVNDFIGKLRERMIDLRSGKAVFVGGGSILLKKYIEASDRIGHAIFVDEINANAKGYELLYKIQKVSG